MNEISKYYQLQICIWWGFKVRLICFAFMFWNIYMKYKKEEMFVKGKLMLIAIEVLKIKARNIENIIFNNYLIQKEWKVSYRKLSVSKDRNAKTEREK